MNCACSGLKALVFAAGLGLVGALPARGEPMPPPTPVAAQTAGVSLRGTVSLFGLDSPAEVAFDAQGRLRWHVNGKVSFTQAFDGERATMLDLGGTPRTLVLREREDVIIIGQVLSGAWRTSGRLKLGEAKDGRTPFDLVDGLATGTITLGDDGQPSVAQWGYGADQQRLNMTGWTRLADGQWGPSRVELIGRASTSVIAGKPSLGATGFTAGATPTDTTFDAKVAPALEVKRAKTGHLLVKTSINGQDAGWFIFDTGAGITCLDRRTQERLKLDTFGGIPAVGIGGTVVSPLCRPGSLTVGPVTMAQPLTIVLDLEDIGKALGEPDLAGVIGFDLLARTVVEFDKAENRILLHDPRAFNDAGQPWQKLYSYERHPCVEAEVEGHRGIFKLDTGAGRMTVAIHGPTVDRLKMLEGRDTTDTQTGGVGGMRPAKAGKVSTFTLAGKTYENLKVTFGLGDQGAFGDRYTLGVIGNQVLMDYVMTLDYGRDRIALAPKPK